MPLSAFPETNGPSVVIVYHSGFGHTATLAQSVAEGVVDGGAAVTLLSASAMTDSDWNVVDSADALIFGSAVYMGNVAAAFQVFAEKTGARCMAGTWRDKVAAGFVNSGAKAGDKLHALTSLAIFAAQHHMHWVSLGLTAGWMSAAGSEEDLNRLGFWLGAGAQTDVDADPGHVHPADLQTCHHLGQRVATVTRHLVVGRLAAAA